MHPSPRQFAVILVGAVLLATSAEAQTTSIIQGSILDSQNLPIAGAEISLTAPALALKIKQTSDGDGFYRLSGLPAGTYEMSVAKPGFETRIYAPIDVSLNRTLQFDVALPLGPARETVRISARPALLETGISSTGGTVFPEQIEAMPLNGRNYLDLMQLVPGVVLNRQADAGTDASTPILGERGGNAIFLIDGMPNGNTVDGGAAAPFDQNSILEFQVLTAGYKAEFGYGSGGVVNVVSKSGASAWHGDVSAFHRNSALDAADVAGASAPFLRRWDLDAALGGPLARDRAFIFGSLERIRESRQLNFSFPPRIPDFLRAREQDFDRHSQTFQTRGFVKLDQVLGTHRLTEEMNLANSHFTDQLPLSRATSLPSTRTNLDARNLMLGLRDTATFGAPGNPFLLSAYLQYRGEPFVQQASAPQGGSAATLFNLFSGLDTGRLTGDLGQVQFGAGFTPLRLDQRSLSGGAHLEKVRGTHYPKFGWDFQRLRVDGAEAGNLLNQLFATTADFSQYGPVNAGVYVLTRVAGLTDAENRVGLRNTYNGLFAQDDWRLSKRLTANLGVRWDYDSQFPNRANFSPRLGLAWAVDSKTVITASWGVFYDHFRLGLARDIPAFGGANLFRNQTISFPRLGYGNPSTLVQLYGLCLSPALTDAQIQASGAGCPAAANAPLLGRDRLNRVVAPGNAPIPANAVVNLDNVQALSGLNPQQFADAASAAVGRQPGFFFWGGFGNLSMNFPVPRIFSIPITVDPGFKTPYTRAVHLGAQRELTPDLVFQADYHHRDVRNMLGVRNSNLAFAARMPGRSGELQPGGGAAPIQSYGPWYEGRYDGISLGIRRRMSRKFTLEAFYTWANAVDNSLHSSFVSEVQTSRGAGFLGASGPTDSFVGVPTLVQDPVTGQTNANGAFTASNGNPVPQAGKFYNGANLDRGPSDLALNHTLLLHGMVRLPGAIHLSGIFRAQSGFHYSAAALAPVDVDGDGLLNGVDFNAGRNHYVSPAYANLDMRFSRRFALLERLRAQVLVEVFNFLNRANPAAVEQFGNVATPFGHPLQYLPGREVQGGLRFAF